MRTIPDLFARAEALRGASLGARSIESVQMQLDDFLTGFNPPTIGRNHEQTWFRTRVCEEDVPYNSLHEMIYPAAGARTFGRAQYPQSKVLYASWNETTTLDEVGATTGDLVQTISLRVRNGVNLPCQVIGEVQFLHATGRTQLRKGEGERPLLDLLQSDIESFQRLLFIDSFLAEVFRKHVKRPYEYKTSAAYAEGLFGMGKIALLYPSVESWGAINIAVPAALFDQVFEVLDCACYRVQGYVGYGLYQLEPVSRTSTFASNGDIDWAAAKQVERSFTMHGGAVFSPGYVGWRKAPQEIPFK